MKEFKQGLSKLVKTAVKLQLKSEQIVSDGNNIIHINATKPKANKFYVGDVHLQVKRADHV